MIVKVVVPDSIYAKVFFARGEQGPQGNTGAQGVQGPTGATGATGANGVDGVGYTGVSSTSVITIGSGLKTWTVNKVAAFLPGMRIRAIHNSSPTTWMEGPANVASGTTIIITVDKFNGSGSHDGWLFAVAGEVGQTGSTGSTGATGATGATGPAGVVANEAIAKVPDLVISGSITRNSNDVVTSAAVIWPDATVGTFTATTINSTFNVIDAYNITYGSPATKTYYQDAVTRNSNGAVTTVPVIRVV